MKWQSQDLNPVLSKSHPWPWLGRGELNAASERTACLVAPAASMGDPGGGELLMSDRKREEQSLEAQDLCNHCVSAPLSLDGEAGFADSPCGWHSSPVTNSFKMIQRYIESLNSPLPKGYQ